MSIYEQKPWLSRYDRDQPAEISLEFTDALSMFRATAVRNPDGDIIRYFGGRITARELDELSDAFAVALTGLGVQAGDRVALYLQNVPQFVIGMLAAWKAGGIAVPVNPMNRARELDAVLRDSGTRVLVCLQSLYRDVASQVAGAAGVAAVVTTSELDYRARDDQRVFAGIERLDGEGTHDMAALIERHRSQRPAGVTFGPDDTAFLTYTSGTTGPPKGAMNTHGNVVFNSQAYRQWCRLGPDDVVLGVAPLFHITGLIAGVTTSLLLGAPLVLAYRFEPSVMLETIRDERATFTVGSITVFIALMNAPGAERGALASLTKIWSGGAPIPPSTVKAFQAQFGQYIHNVYGLTETTSPSHGVPFDATAPVDDATGALSVGVPVFNTVVRVVGDDGRNLPAGEVGEIVTSGPMVVPGYWNKPEETEHALPGGALHTGDVGYMDADGWFYLIDRKKDQINAGGYKVWPREVEDVLYQHEAVREAAVVGVPDAYRGETVKAYVSLRPGQTATAEDLIA
ncbi:MAG TPA: AMP-binding protein, partial [Jatrophihabitantaceae bacterium]